MNGGNLTVEVGQGDTDPIDSNGNITVTGGTIKMTGQTGFDFDGTATYTGGDIYLNGEKQTEIVKFYAWWRWTSREWWTWRWCPGRRP